MPRTVGQFLKTQLREGGGNGEMRGMLERSVTKQRKATWGVQMPRGLHWNRRAEGKETPSVQRAVSQHSCVSWGQGLTAVGIVPFLSLPHP